MGPRLVTRLWQLAVAGAAMLAVSLSWILLFTVTPAGRPAVRGRLDGQQRRRDGLRLQRAGAVRHLASRRGCLGAGDQRRACGAPGYGGPGDPFGLPFGLFKLLSGWYGPQAGWLYPLAVLGLVAGLYLTRWAPRGNPVRCGFLMWGTWLCTAGLVFSVMTTLPHTAYLAMLAPPVAALAAAGICVLAHVYRAGRPSGWLLPAAVLAEVLWAGFLWRDYRGFLPWALTAALAAGLPPPSPWSRRGSRTCSRSGQPMPRWPSASPRCWRRPPRGRPRCLT